MKKLLALLLAATMLLTLCACGNKNDQKDEGDTTPAYGDPPPEDIAAAAEAFIIAYCTQDRLAMFDMYCYDALQQWKDKAVTESGKTEAEICAEAQAQADENGFTFDYPIDTLDKYLQAYHEIDLQYKDEAYGAYTIKVEVLGSVEMTAERVAEYRGIILGAGGDYADVDAVNAITTIHEVTVRLLIEGEKKTKDETYSVYIANFKGEWHVAGHTT